MAGVFNYGTLWAWTIVFFQSCLSETQNSYFKPQYNAFLYPESAFQLRILTTTNYPFDEWNTVVLA